MQGRLSVAASKPFPRTFQKWRYLDRQVQSGTQDGKERDASRVVSELGDIAEGPYAPA